MNPFTNYPISDDWADHIRRGSAGGIDYVMPVGTPLPAPSDGFVTFLPNNGTGGHTATIRRADGTRTQYMHLSRFVGAARTVRAGEIVGYSGGAKGAPGAGSSTGPHLHTHDLTASGKRVPPFSTIRKVSVASITLPILNRKRKKTMNLAHIPGGGGKAGHLFLLFNDSFYKEFTGQSAANAFAKQCGGSSAPVSRQFFDEVKAQVDANRR